MCRMCAQDRNCLRSRARPTVCLLACLSSSRPIGARPRQAEPGSWHETGGLISFVLAVSGARESDFISTTVQYEPQSVSFGCLLCCLPTTSCKCDCYAATVEPLTLGSPQAEAPAFRSGLSLSLSLRCKSRQTHFCLRN